MKVEVDYDLCESNSLCEAIAPETFRVDDDDNLQLLDDLVTDEDLGAIEQAVASCPRSALSIVDG